MLILISYYDHCADPYPAPYIFISSADLTSGTITFNWNPVALYCPAIQYKANASNCGSCSPTETERTELTCVNVPSNELPCMLAVQAFTCNHTLGNQSEVLSIKLTNQSPTRGLLKFNNKR